MDKTEKNLEAMIDRILVEHNKPTILPKPVPSYEHDFSEYPELIRVSFSDGMTAVYCLQPASPAPVFRENVELRTGYPKARKRRRTR